MFEGFPYTNFHELNLDWIIKIAKDFLDQYTNIQNIIESGEDSLSQTITDGLQSLNNKAEELTDALNTLYEEHAGQLDNQLVAAIASVNSAKETAVANFNTQASQIGSNVIASIPADYTTLSNNVANLMATMSNDGVYFKSFTMNAGSSHSSNSDLLSVPLNFHESAFILVRPNSGEYFTGAAVVKNAQNETTANVGFVANTLTPFTVSGASATVGLYIPALQTTTQINVYVYRTYSDYIKAYLNNLSMSQLLDYGLISFPAMYAHSATTDMLSYAIPANTNFKVELKSSGTLTGSIVFYDASNTQLGQAQITNNTPRTFNLDYSIAKFGVYIPEQMGTMLYTLMVIPETSFLYDADDSIVSVFKENMDAAIDKMAVASKNDSVSFAFITDLHYETNFRNSPELIKYIIDHSRIRTVINGGDNSSGESDVNDQIEWLYKSTGDLSGFYNLYSVVGNHDDNSVGSGTIIPAEQIKRLMLPPADAVTYGAGNYYYKDINDTRFFFLDDQEGEQDTTQIEWVRDNMSDSMNHFVFVMHMIYITESATNPCPFFQDLLSLFNSIPAALKDKIVAVFAGHQHHDHVYEFSGVKAIVTTTDSRFADDGIQRVEGTLSSQCFDLVCIDYTNSEIKLFRIGSIGTDRTVTF